MDLNDEPTLSTHEVAQRVGERKFPRVTIESIKDKVAKVDYIPHDTMTIAVLTMSNGFKVIGKAAPADARNYDPAIGERYAFDDAIKQVWRL